MTKPLLAALAGDQPSRTPVWFMRQAGRSLPEYKRVREGIGMLDSCFRPDLLAEITMQPVRRHGVDGAILFSDIVVPLKAAGVNVEIVPGRGPVMDAPLTDPSTLPILDEPIDEIAEGIRLIEQEIAEKYPETTLIGFAGAPFTLASYLVEGGPSRNHERTKALMFSDPDTWHALMQRLVPTIVTFLRGQIEAGVEAVQLFDSWAGCLREADYREFVLPYSSQILAEVGKLGVPRIHFGVGTGEILGAMADAGSECLGVDWRVPLDVAAKRTAEPKVLQGNLDPAVLFCSDEVIAREVARIKGEAGRAVAQGDARGHIFNLGHGVLPETDAETITRTVAMIHKD